MSSLPVIQTGALARLADELKFVPAAAARRHVAAAEVLWQVIDATTTYPEDWIAAKITGFRPEIKEPALVSGEALLRDLGALVERLSVRAEFVTAELTGWLTVAQVCERWRINIRTLERYKRDGLISRRARRDDRRTVVMYSRESIERFEKRRAKALAVAGAYSRMSEEEHAKILRRARRYVALFGFSRFVVATRIARAIGRSPEAVRLALAEHDARAPHALFTEPGPIGVVGARMIARAMRRNIGAPVIAKRLRKSIPAVTKAWLGFRVRELTDAVGRGRPEGEGGKASAGPFLGPGADAKVGEKALAHGDVTKGLGRPAARSLPEAVAAAMLAGWPDAGREKRLIEGYRFLRARAQETLASQAEDQSAAGLDAAVTDLRWASMLKCELVRGEQMLLLKTVESQVGKALVDLEPGDAVMLYDECTRALIESIERFDASRGGRMAAPAGLALSRAVARWIATRYDRRAEGLAQGRAAVRAAMVHPVAVAALADWTRVVDAWQPLIEPDVRLREATEFLKESDSAAAGLLAARFGWTGDAPPRRVLEIGKETGKPANAVSRRERTAVIAALAAWRARHGVVAAGAGKKPIAGKRAAGGKRPAAGKGGAAKKGPADKKSGGKRGTRGGA